MNKQRKVLITTTYNEMGIIIDTKAEEVAQPNLQPTCNRLATDCISRQAAIAAVSNWLYDRDDGRSVDQLLSTLPAAQPQRKTDEWCSDCKEYDQEQHCCPRWNRVIRQTLSEQRKTGKWTDDNACPFCGFQPWYERDIHTLSFCPNCGADMRGDGE